MKRRTTTRFAYRAGVLVAAVALTAVPRAAPAAETGDVDGDGRLSIADVLHIEDGVPAVPGSLDAFERTPCFTEWWVDSYATAAIFVESLRRAVPDPLPSWDHFWPSDAGRDVPPLPPDPVVSIEIWNASAPGGDDDRVMLRLLVTAAEHVRAFSIIVDTDGALLRVPPAVTPWGFKHWDERAWRLTSATLGNPWYVHESGDIAVIVTPPTFLITGGRLVVTYNLTDDFSVLAPGEYEIKVEARLPVGTTRGEHEVRVLPGSEVLLEDGRVIAPSLADPAALSVLEEVRAGWDEGVPPLVVDGAERRVEGRVELRFVDADGRPAQDGQPLVAALPGEEVVLRLQFRTETPLNTLDYRVRWPASTLSCNPEPELLFSRPGGEGLYLPTAHGGNLCSGDHAGVLYGYFLLAGADSSVSIPNLAERPFDYFEPLGEWVDVVEVRFTIASGVGGGTEIPLRFSPYDNLKKPVAEFSPYTLGHPCNSDRQPGDVYWHYDTILHDTSIRVLGDQPPEPPPDFGIRVDLLDAVATGDGVVDVPVLASATADLDRLIVVVEYDPDALIADDLDLELLSPIERQPFRSVLTPGDGILNYECIDENNDGQPEECFAGVPLVAWNRETPPGAVFLDILTGEEGYPGDVEREIGSLRFRVREGFAGVETEILPGSVVHEINGLESEYSSGGHGFLLAEDGRFSPAVVSGARVTIGGRGFYRGDANGDRRLDVSDALTVLNYLYLGGDAPACLDAADADDTGAIEITDPINVLGFLFLGQGTLPPPGQRCGVDPTGDTLGCLEASCVPTPWGQKKIERHFGLDGPFR